MNALKTNCSFLFLSVCRTNLTYTQSPVDRWLIIHWFSSLFICSWLDSCTSCPVTLLKSCYTKLLCNTPPFKSLEVSKISLFLRNSFYSARMHWIDSFKIFPLGLFGQKGLKIFTFWIFFFFFCFVGFGWNLETFVALAMWTHKKNHGGWMIRC